MRLIDADKLKPDCMTKDGRFAISQSQIANAKPIQPSTDAVSRQELMKEFAELPHEYKNAEERARTGGISACQVIVLKAPPVYPTRPKGRWIGYVRSNGTVYHCEKCGRKTVVKENFCPSCGYDMKEGE